MRKWKGFGPRCSGRRGIDPAADFGLGEGLRSKAPDRVSGSYATSLGQRSRFVWQRFSQRQRPCSSGGCTSKLAERPEDLGGHTSQCLPGTWSDTSKRRTIAFADINLEQRVPIGDRRRLGQLGPRSLDDVRGARSARWGTGLAEPNFPADVDQPRQIQLHSFGKSSCPDLGCSQHELYLKEEDIFDARLRQIGLTRGPHASAEDEEKAPSDTQTNYILVKPGFLNSAPGYILTRVVMLNPQGLKNRVLPVLFPVILTHQILIHFFPAASMFQRQ